MHTEKVSIIIPVFNVEDYLNECIDSALKQTHQNKEIIIINDGSTDGSGEIINKYKTTNPELKVICTKNQGQSAARNTGLDACSGDYVIFLDSDDWLEDDAISVCLDAAKKLNVDIVFFGGKAFSDGLPPEKASEFNYERRSEHCDHAMNSRKLFEKLIESNQYIVSPCLYMYKFEELKEIRFLPGSIHEDNLFTTELLTRSETTTAACIRNQPFHRRIRPESTMTQEKGTHHVNGYMNVARELSILSSQVKSNRTKKAIDKFIQTTIRNAINTAQTINNGNVPADTKRKCRYILFSIPLRHIEIKSILYCLIPEIKKPITALKKRINLKT